MEPTSYPALLNKQRIVTSEYAMAHTDELLKTVNQNNEAILIRNNEDLAVLVPYWWYMVNFGTNVPMIVDYLFEECRNPGMKNTAINLAIADGYFSHVSRIVGQEIRQSLLDKIENHTHAEQWQELLDRWSGKWQENDSQELWLVMAKFAGDRQIYLLYQNGTTRLLDGRKLIGRGLKAEALNDESVFYDRIRITSGALHWMSEEDRIQWAVSSDELLELSIPVDPDMAKTIWDSQRIRK